MLTIAALFSKLSRHRLAETVSLLALDRFIRFTRHLKQELSLGLVDPSIPCGVLPQHVLQFLVHCVGLPPDVLQQLWADLGTTIWQQNLFDIQRNEQALFDEFGSRTDNKQERLAFTMFYPPCTSCRICGKILSHLSRVAVTYFSKDGALPAFSTSLRCVNGTCQIRYYHNYFVKLKENRRYYYDHSIPDVLHVEEHSFMAMSLSELFTAWTLFAWVSSQNCAAIYNHALSGHGDDDVSDSKYLLTSRQVWRAFVLNSLLRDGYERRRTMIMSEAGDLDVRLKSLMEE